MKEEFQQLKKLLPELKRAVPLKNYTTFKIGGPARYFFKAKTKEELQKAIEIARKHRLPFFILGGGSNLLVSDEGYKGLVIRIKNQESRIKNHIIYIEAGAPLGQLVDIALKNSLSGLEWATGIPGTVGGAIWGNAGAFGKSMSDITKTVTVLEVDSPQPRVKSYKNEDCQFEYRSSIFKHNPNLIIFSVEIQLKTGDKKEIKKRIKEYSERKRQTQPLNFPSAGCVFKNPANSYAGLLIDKCGLKGRTIGKAQISKKHANFIINLGEAKAKDVLELIELIKKEVKEKFNIELKEEIGYLGFSQYS